MNKKKIVVFSGAGLSQESGIPTFRDSNGLWHNHKVEDVASHEAWDTIGKQPIILAFYADRWKNIKACEPNAAHKAFAKLEEKYDVLHITQNIDDLLERAGCTNVWHLHGSINSRKCEWHKDITNLNGDTRYTCDYKEDQTKPVVMGERCPKCQGFLRPDVVWFGEAVDTKEQEMMDLAKETDVFIGVGTSAQVQPAAGLLYVFRNSKQKYFVDLNPPLRLQSFTRIQGTASEHIPALVEQLLTEEVQEDDFSLPTHEWLMEIRNNNSQVYAWDFVLSPGIALKGKYEDLLGHVNRFCLRKNTAQPRSVIANKGLVSTFVVCSVGTDEDPNGNFEPIYKEVSPGIVHVGKWKRSLANGFHSDFDLYQNENFSHEEVFICGPDINKVIKIYNFFD